MGAQRLILGGFDGRYRIPVPQSKVFSVSALSVSWLGGTPAARRGPWESQGRAGAQGTVFNPSF
jgi:hypothetical protein